MFSWDLHVSTDQIYESLHHIIIVVLQVIMALVYQYYHLMQDFCIVTRVLLVEVLTTLNQITKTAKIKLHMHHTDTHMTTHMISNKTTNHNTNALYMLHYSPLSPCVLASD